MLTQWCHIASYTLVYIGLGNTLSKPLHEPRLTNNQWGLVALTRWQFAEMLKIPTLDMSYWFKIYSRLSQEPKNQDDLSLMTPEHFNIVTCYYFIFHDDVIKWNHFPRYWLFVRRIHRSPLNSPHKGQRRGVWCFLLFASEQTDK